MQEFQINGPYIELIGLLKALGIAETGGHAKAIVEEGPALKRFRPCARGSSHPYKKRMSHLYIVLTDEA